MLSDLMVLVSPAGGFTIVDRQRMLTSVPPLKSVEDIADVMAGFLASVTWMTEQEVRAELIRLGLTPSAVDEQIAAAIHRLAVMSSQPTLMERITRIGYRNAEGQEVVRRTAFVRAGQSVFVLRCTVCGHEYGSYGCDADIRRCPRCQDGPAAIATD